MIWGGLLNMKYMFRFPVKYLSETFFIVRIIQLYIIMNLHWCICNAPVIAVRM